MYFLNRLKEKKTSFFPFAISLIVRLLVDATQVIPLLESSHTNA